MKDALMEYYAMESKINRLRQAMALLRHRMQNPSGARLSDTPKGQGRKDWVAECMGEIDDLRRRCEALQAKRMRLMAALQTLSAAEQRILYLRYGRKKPWLAIGMETNYSERQAQRIHNRALTLLRQALPNEGEAMWGSA